MKTELNKIAKDLDKGTITDNEARTLLLGLLIVSGCFPTDEEIERFGDQFCESEQFKPNTTFSFKDGMYKCMEYIKEKLNNR